MCSKCHKEMIVEQEQAKLAASSIDNIANGNDNGNEAVAPVSLGTAPAKVELNTSQSEQPVDVVGSGEAEVLVAKEKEGPNSCNMCKKRVGLTGFNCRCGNLFCGPHRYSDKHSCPFDYQTEARDAIAKANPVVKAEKLDKI